MEIGGILVVAPLWTLQDEAEFHQEMLAQGASEYAVKSIRRHRDLASRHPFVSAGEYRYYLGPQGILRNRDRYRIVMVVHETPNWKYGLWLAQRFLHANEAARPEQLMLRGIPLDGESELSFTWVLEFYNRPIARMPLPPGIPYPSQPMPEMDLEEITGEIPICKHCGRKQTLAFGVPPSELRRTHGLLAESILPTRAYKRKEERTLCLAG